MKKSLLFILAIPLWFSITVHAQNLVPNSSFEEVARIPTLKYNPVECAKYWRSPTFTSSDYYLTGQEGVGAPENRFGKQAPHTGKAYAGFCIKKPYVEYIATTLTDTLKSGQEYLVEFYVNRAEESTTSVDELGILFATRAKWSIDMDPIAQKPAVDFINKKGYTDMDNWVKLSATYKAEGFETALIIGHFVYDKPKSNGGYSHYYIDDVSVTPVKENEITEQTEAGEVTVTSNAEIKEETVFSPKLGEAMTLNNIFFTSGESELLPESFPELDKLVQFLNRDLKTKIEISGHTDNTGNAKQNKTLSGLRAKAVADYLILKGINTIRVSSQGFGSTRPVAVNHTEEGRAKNRRVEFVVK
ncbi:MAG: OmpA/MotB domain protein [Bacteroidetes bacterium]|jgi:outer membrane protein OmpA-like peptidoglycan-associated protein|nr:OmpA/MotB domain protein [Bacteroidota bacterium]